MFYIRFLCLFITFNFQFNRFVQTKAWPDQIGWSDPYYSQEPITTTTTVKPLYPTLYRNNPHPVPFDDDAQRQVPVKPYDVYPSQPIGGNQYNGKNNFNYPYDSIHTPPTYPPFDGSTRRNTFPTRRQFYTISPQNSFNNSVSSNHNHTNQFSNHRPDHTGNNYPNQNTRNNGDFQHRPFPSPQFYDRNNNGPTPNPGNDYQNRNRYNDENRTSHQSHTPFQNSQFYNGNDNNQAVLNGGSDNHNRNAHNNNPTNQNRPFSNLPFNDGRNQYQSNYRSNNDGSTNQNSYAPSAPPSPRYPILQKPQQPDYDPNGVALAPFPDENDDPNSFGARKNFNYDNLHHRHPSKLNVNTNPSSRFGDSDGTKLVPLASYTSFSGVQVPLAPLQPY